MNEIDSLIEEVKNLGNSLKNNPDDSGGLEEEPTAEIPEKRWYHIADAISRNDTLLEAILKSVQALRPPEAPAAPIPTPIPSPPPLPPIPPIPGDLLGKMDTLINLTTNINDVMKNLPAGKRTRVLNFSYAIGIGNTVRLGDDVPFTGNVISVLIEFPVGCNSLVDVSVKAGTRGIVPQVGYISLNDVTPILNVREPVVIGEEIIVEIRNRDPLNVHAIEVNVIIMEE